MQTHVVIIGAGPAGLTAAYLLAKENIKVTVLEADPQYVGGIARTESYKGYCFDIGGHRFFSKSDEVETLWTELLPHDMLERERSSRILYQEQFFSYPLKPFESLRKLGFTQSLLCVLSYLKARVLPIRHPTNFTEWVTNHFGERLYSIFFKTYTEKVWGMKCEDISADWAAQRIKGLSLYSAIMSALVPKTLRKHKGKIIKTLIDHFRYPRKGPGMLWEACAHKIKLMNGDIRLGNEVYRCEYRLADKRWEIHYRDSKSDTHQLTATHVISSAPLRELVLNYLRPFVSPPSLIAANELHYRDFMIVALILKDRHQLKDNWIYVHDKSVDVARIQNFKSWSPEMVPDQSMCCYGLEYFCFKGDKWWDASDQELIAKATRELIQLGLAKQEDIVDGCVVRQPKAYPVYNKNYQTNVNIICNDLAAKFPTLYLVGRNGMHKYNNQDHAMMTAMLTVKNILANKCVYDVWRVNQDGEYIEAGYMDLQSGLRSVPTHASV